MTEQYKEEDYAFGAEIRFRYVTDPEFRARMDAWADSLLTPTETNRMSDNNPTGVTRFSFAGRSVVKMVMPPPAPPGEYEFAVLPDGIETRTAEASVTKPDPIPYVSYRIGLHNSAEEGKKDKIVFCMALIGLNPGKDTVLNFERPSGILALSQSLGLELPDFEVVERPTKDGTGTIKYFNPEEVKTYLKSCVGVAGKAVIKVEDDIRKDDKGNPLKKNTVGIYVARS